MPDGRHNIKDKIEKIVRECDNMIQDTVKTDGFESMMYPTGNRCDMSILNIHGYKGTPHNAAYSALCGLAKTIISPQIDYDSEQPDTILNRLLNICAPEKIDMIVGTSLGGFFASLIAVKLQKPLLLVNPCLQPQIVIPALGYESDVSRFSEMSAVFDDLDRKRVRCIIGGKDEVIGDHEYTKQLLGANNIIVIPDGMHSGATLELYKHFPEMMKSIKDRS